MNIPNEIRAIELRTKGAGHSVDDLCKAARINRATWQRWKGGESIPNLRSWLRVTSALQTFENEAVAEQDHAA